MRRAQTLLGIVAAFEQEAGWARRRLHLRHRAVTEAGTCWQGRLHGQEVVLIRCGMGASRASRATAWLVQHYKLWGLMSIGFAGGLQTHLATGDAVLVPRVLAYPAGAEAASALRPAMIRLDARLTRLAAMAADRAALTKHWGPLLSASEVMPQAVTKARYGQESGALAVDMESYSVGHIAAVQHLPFMVLRTVFDMCSEDLSLRPDVFTTADGALRPMRLLGYVVHHPYALTQMLPLWRKARIAGNRLEAWLRHFLTILGHDG